MTRGLFLDGQERPYAEVNGYVLDINILLGTLMSDSVEQHTKDSPAYQRGKNNSEYKTDVEFMSLLL